VCTYSRLYPSKYAPNHRDRDTPKDAPVRRSSTGADYDVAFSGSIPHAAGEGYEVLKVLEEVADAGYSGASLERPGMDRVRELIAGGALREPAGLRRCGPGDAGSSVPDPLHLRLVLARRVGGEETGYRSQSGTGCVCKGFPVGTCEQRYVQVVIREQPWLRWGLPAGCVFCMVKV
jgi:hypothetical protein